MLWYEYCIRIGKVKLNNEQGTGVQSNVQTKSLDFGIGDPAMVIEILRKRLYSNPIQTLVQEYISNGRDACREAQLPERVVVTIPTSTNKVFKVRDYGCGISPERIANVFVNYASSTKRTDNKQTGGFGIGAKSAWAYTDNFTVISYYEGTAYHYVAHLGVKNIGSMDLMSETSTTEPNGCEIQIAVAEKDLDAFERAVYRCTFFWTKRPEIRGIAPSCIPDWYRAPKLHGKILDLAFYKPSDLGNFFYPGILLVVDGIPYTVPFERFHASTNQFVHFKDDLICAIPVKTGEVEIAASRESLVDETQVSLSILMHTLNKSVKAHVKTTLETSKDLKDFLIQYKAFDTMIHVGSQTFGNYTQADKFIGHNANNAEFILTPTSKGDKLRLECSSNQWNKLYKYSHFLYVSGDLPNKVTLYSKVRTYLLNQPEIEGMNRRALVIYECGDQPAFKELISSLQAIDLDTIELDKKETVKAPKPDGEIVVTTMDDVRSHYRRVGHDSVKVDLNTNTEKFVYIEKEKPETFTGQKNSYREFAKVLQIKFKLQLCFVAPATMKKIESDPNFISVTKFWENPFVYMNVTQLKELELEILSVNIYEVLQTINWLFSEEKLFKTLTSKVKDQEFTDSLTYMKGLKYDSYYGYGGDRDKTWLKIKSLYTNENVKLQAQLNIDKNIPEIIRRYPLLNSSTSDIKELEFYLNAKYEACYAKGK